MEVDRFMASGLMSLLAKSLTRTRKVGSALFYDFMSVLTLIHSCRLHQNVLMSVPVVKSFMMADSKTLQAAPTFSSVGPDRLSFHDLVVSLCVRLVGLHRKTRSARLFVSLVGASQQTL